MGLLLPRRAIYHLLSLIVQVTASIPEHSQHSSLHLTKTQRTLDTSFTSAMADQQPFVPDNSDLLTNSAGYVKTGWPAPGLRRNVRHITGHNAEGKGIFLSTDCGDHHRVMGNEQAIANIIYSTKETPVELNGDADIKYAKENEVRYDPITSLTCF
jgi:hypothetical protein